MRRSEVPTPLLLPTPVVVDTRIRANKQLSNYDDDTRARWEARRPAIQAAIRRERQVLAWALVVGVLAALSLATALVLLLVHAGLPLLVAFVCAALLASGSGCGCVITVTHVCGH